MTSYPRRIQSVPSSYCSSRRSSVPPSSQLLQLFRSHSVSSKELIELSSNSCIEEGSPSSSSPVSPSSLIRKLLGTNDDERCEEAKKLESVLIDRQFRNELVHNLLGNHSDAVLKVRFVCAVNEVIRTTDRMEKSRKARKVVNAFVKTSAKYHINGIPASFMGDLLQTKYKAFIAVSNNFSIELLRDPLIAEMVSNHESIVEL